ncbi:MAG: hypothetical protein ABSB60_13685 [Terracidiphilus sp.]|jgi:hypothetical protein
MFDEPTNSFSVRCNLYVPKAGLPFHESYGVIAPISGQDMKHSFAVRGRFGDDVAIRGKRQRAP